MTTAAITISQYYLIKNKKRGMARCLLYDRQKNLSMTVFARRGISRVARNTGGMAAKNSCRHAPRSDRN